MMHVSDFDYSLPEDRIAQSPAPRGQSRLLHLSRRGLCSDHRVENLPEILRPGDLLVVNDTRVIPARLYAQGIATGGKLELLLAERISSTEWLALARPGKRARLGTRFDLDGDLQVEVVQRLDEGQIRIRFSEPIEPHLDRLGHVPLPPYIRRRDQSADKVDYQTVYADRPGAIAAPTAGLHFSRALLDEMKMAGIGLATITLHVGIGTFRPVTAELIDNHRMESERFEISAESASAISSTRSSGGRIVAVGTTVVRTLESIVGAQGEITASSGRTDLFIRPGYRFRAVDLMLTNFHLPRSTLLMLVCAFAGRHPLLNAYNHALTTGYRFYSYGDCMLVETPEQIAVAHD
jgi:S-adenosylmethionine:tRNA ribosyltransferase-isomerase